MKELKKIWHRQHFNQAKLEFLGKWITAEELIQLDKDLLNKMVEIQVKFLFLFLVKSYFKNSPLDMKSCRLYQSLLLLELTLMGQRREFIVFITLDSLQKENKGPLEEEEEYRIYLPAEKRSRTKTLSIPIPNRLTPFLTFHLQRVRPLLLGKMANTSSIWINLQGNPLFQ